jgi:REP element-mobilizing transposase RayT
MPFDPQKHHRRSIRLKGYDYTQPGAYFVTVVTHGRECLFGEIVDREMRLNEAGRMVEQCWLDIPSHFPHVELDAFVIMPNHVHLVFKLINKNKSITDLMKSIKRYSARKANEILITKGKFWQVESFDRWVRDEKELYNIIKYVLLNPVNAGLVEDYKDWQHTYCHPDYSVM